MIELSEQPDEEPLSRVDQLLQLIGGSPREFPVNHQVLNWLLSVNVFLVGLGGVENTLLGIVPAWHMYAGSAVFACFYYLTRVRRMWVGALSAVSLALWLGMLAVGWFTNNGLL